MAETAEMLKLLLIFLAFSQIQGERAFRVLHRNFEYGCKDCFTWGQKDKDIWSNTMLCKDLDPKKPYCDILGTKECVSEDKCTSSMKCQYKGLFPNPMDCNKFFLCEKGGVDAQVFKCPEKSNYDHSKKICSSVMLASACPNFSSVDPKGLCYNKNGIPVPYPNDPSIYVMCSNSKTLPEELKSCKSKDMKVNVKTFGKTCDYVCKQEGFNPSPNGENKYIICVKDGTNFTAQEQDCPADTVFDKDPNGLCIGTGGGNHPVDPPIVP